MFVGFTKTLKKMSGFRLGFGLRVNKRNAPLWCLAMLFAGMFYLMWYMIIGAGWCLYFMCWAIYKVYYYMFKGIVIGCKKLYQLVKGEAAPVGAVSSENSYEFLKTKIAGVTFKDGRKNRQTILRCLYWKDEPFDKENAEVILEREEFEGNPAFAVLLNGEKAGYVPTEKVPFIVDNYDRCDGVTNIEAYCGANDIYGAEITIRFRKI